jgi:hypothetical protein
LLSWVGKLSKYFSFQIYERCKIIEELDLIINFRAGYHVSSQSEAKGNFVQINEMYLRVTANWRDVNQKDPVDPEFPEEKFW